MFRNTKTFTLIEMLIVIVIIGILAAALVPRLQSVQSRARDTKRKVDLKVIYDANEIFKLDRGRYANTGMDTSSFGTTSATWIPELLTVINTVPVDPLNNNSLYADGGFSYYYRHLNALTVYALRSKLENQADPKTANFIPYVYPHTSSPVTGLNLYPTYSYTRWWYVFDPMNIKFH